MPFVRIAITSDAKALADAAVASLVTRWPDWEPNDGDLEVIQIETLAPMAQNAAEVAAIVPDAIFRGFGTDLIGLSYQVGTAATGSVTVTAVDDAGYDAGGQIELYLGGVAFLTDDAVVIPAGDTTAELPITALVTGTEGNGLSGPADPATALAWLDTLEVTAPTAGGADPEDDAAYQERLADRLLLQATTLVTGRDFELMALEDDRIGRALATVGTAREVTVTITDNAGEPIPDPPTSTVKTDLAALYEDYRQVNTLYTIEDADYTTIDVTFTLVALPSYDPDDVVRRAEDEVTAWLDPLNWGQPIDQPSVSNVWLNETKVRYSELLRVISVMGVRYVQAATLEGGTADVTLTGTTPLTRAGTVAGAWAAS